MSDPDIVEPTIFGNFLLTVLQQKKPFIITSGNNNGDKFMIDVFRQATNNHLKGCNYERRAGDKPIDGK